MTASNDNDAANGIIIVLSFTWESAEGVGEETPMIDADPGSAEYTTEQSK